MICFIEIGIPNKPYNVKYMMDNLRYLFILFPNQSQLAAEVYDHRRSHFAMRLLEIHQNVAELNKNYRNRSFFICIYLV